jgi:hypothetical protein
MGKFREYPVFRMFEKKFGTEQACKTVDALEKWYTEKMDEAQFLEDWLYLEKLDYSDDDILEIFREKSLLPSPGVFALTEKRAGLA